MGQSVVSCSWWEFGLWERDWKESWRRIDDEKAWSLLGQGGPIILHVEAEVVVRPLMNDGYGH